MTSGILAGLLGGVGLFLLGMRMMTEGLKLAAGTALRDILHRWTSSTLRGIASGALLTGLVQSSSAVTVATIGFVNAGVLTLSQGIGVIYGSNIGTTITGWLVALVGFQFNIKALSLPLIGVGMLIRLVSGERRLGRSGEALAGFGILFLGIDVLKVAFDGVSDAFELSSLSADGLAGNLLFVGIGIVLTVLMQSSSAAIAVILTAVGTDAVTVRAGAALVIGANMGTTTTAALAVIGATPNAKRIALAHIIFNVLTGLVALMLLSVLLDGLAGLRAALGLSATAPAVLALFHTAFNLLGVLLMAPLTGRMVVFLEQRFRTFEEIESRPQHLDRTVLQMPYLGLSALALELRRVAGIVRRIVTDAIKAPLSAHELESGQAVVDRLLEASGQFSVDMRQTAMPAAVAEALPSALRASGYLAEMMQLTTAMNRTDASAVMTRLDLVTEYTQFKERVLAALDERLDSALQPGATPPGKRQIGKGYQALKILVLRRAAEEGLAIRQVIGALDNLQVLRRIANRARKCALYLAPLLVLDGALPTEADREAAEKSALEDGRA